MISLEVLEALLSNDTNRRQAAETHFQSLSVNDRVLEWPSVWQQAATQAQGTSPLINAALPHMIAVLWRRDILNCTTNLMPLLEPLQQIFASNGNNIADEKIRAAIGHCLAEVVALVQTNVALEQTLQTTEALFKSHPGPVLQLFEALGHAVPAEFWSPQVISWILDRIQSLAPVTSSTAGFSTAASLAQSNRMTVQIVDTLAALAPYTNNTNRIESILKAWLVNTTDVDTLSHILESTGTHFETLPDAFWQATWQQVQPHAGSEPRLVCQALERLANVLTQEAHVIEALQMLVRILAQAVDEDTTDWSAVEWLEDDSYEVDHDEEGLTSYAMDVLYMWLTEHGEVLPALLQMVQSPDASNWRSVWTTLTVWQICSTSLPVALEPYASTLFQGLSQIIASDVNHLRVRHQAWQTLAGFLQTYPDVLNNKDGLATAIRQGLMDGNPRVSAAVCRVLISMAVIETTHDVWNQGQLEILLQGLIQGPLSTNVPCRLVVVRGLRAVAALSRCAPLGVFYAPTMSLIMEWSQREASVTGDALEAASLVTQSLVEDENLTDRVSSDAQALMERLLHTLEQSGSGMDREPLLSACARLAPVLGERFQPYLPTVLRLLLDKILARDEIEFGDGDAEGLDQTRRRDWTEDSLTVSVPGRGLTKVTLHTSQIQEKAQAIRALYELLVALPAAWAPFLDTAWRALEPLLSYTYHADIRTTAAQSMAALVEAGLASEVDQVWAGLPRAVASVSEQLNNDSNTEREERHAIADSLSEMLFSVFSRKNENDLFVYQNFTIEVADHVVQHCGHALQKCLQRRATLAVQLSKSDIPDEQARAREELQEEQKLMTPLVDSIGYTMKILGPAFSSIFEQKVLPLIGPFLSPNVDSRARWSAVCLFDDCVEHCGPETASRFAPQLLPAVLSGMTDASDQDLQQVSIYGIAQIARHAPASILVPHADTIIQTLASMAGQPKETFNNLAVHENCVSALASLVVFPAAPFRGKYIKTETALKIMLDNMPLSMDYDEAQICSAGLCDLVESASIPCASYTQSLVRVIGETLSMVSGDEEVASETTCARMVEILTHLQREGSSADLQDAFTALSPESQAAVQFAVQRCSYMHKNVVTP